MCVQHILLIMKPSEVNLQSLKTSVSRAVLIAPDIDPKSGQKYTDEVVFTIRPGWSKVQPYVTALPGGKIEADKGDFSGVVEASLLEDPWLVLTLEQMIQAGLMAAKREILEELGILLTTGLLQFVDVSTNPAGWTTYSYVGELAQKPTVTVKPDSAGVRWISARQILKGKPKLLPGHLGITRRAISKIR